MATKTKAVVFENAHGEFRLIANRLEQLGAGPNADQPWRAIKRGELKRALNHKDATEYVPYTIDASSDIIDRGIPLYQPSGELYAIGYRSGVAKTVNRNGRITKIEIGCKVFEGSSLKKVLVWLNATKK